ncbi:porin [Shewanella putrefaciens]|nr:porin [Shewanella putrefaciens]
MLPVLLTATSQAIELYKDSKNSLDLSGWLGFAALNDSHDTSVIDDLSRVRFSFERNEKHGWTAFATTEWGINMVSSDDSLVMQGGKLAAEKNEDFLYNRLGYVGMSHDEWGSLSFGKQWGVYYDIHRSTQRLCRIHAFSDGGLTGTGRADIYLPQYARPSAHCPATPPKPMGISSLKMPMAAKWQTLNSISTAATVPA